MRKPVVKWVSTIYYVLLKSKRYFREGNLPLFIANPMKHIFFDLDGTLHQEDTGALFIKYLIKRRIINLIIFLPFLLIALGIYYLFPTKRASLNLILFFTTLGSTKKQYQQYINGFCKQFLPTPIPQVYQAFEGHLAQQDNIFIISGSPLIIIEKLYPDWFKHPYIHVIGSLLTYRFGSLWLTEYCLAENKIKMLDERFQPAIQFEMGYSDSMTDLPLFLRSKQAFKITKGGELQELRLQAVRS